MDKSATGAQRILIIEDEETLAEALRYTLGREGYAVEVEHDGRAGLRRFQNEGADLLLLDLMLPGIDGLEVCRTIRRDSRVPILMLTAKDTEMDEVVGLELGADDYVTKPFNMRSLIARIRALMRRTADTGDERGVLRCGNVTVDTAAHEVAVGGEAIHLTPLEYRLLELFMRSPGKALSREYLLENAWQGDFYGPAKNLDVHIRHLREKIEEDPAEPRMIRTVRGTGYRMERTEERD